MRCRLSPIKSIIGLAAALALPAFHGTWAQAADPLRPQASLPAIQLAAAAGNKFDGEWKGTFVGSGKWCGPWDVPIEVTIKNGEYSVALNLEGSQNKWEGSVSNDGKLSFWDNVKFNFSTPINITGKFRQDEFLGDFHLGGSWATHDPCAGKIKMTRLGSAADLLRTASREELNAILQAKGLDLKNPANLDPEIKARPGKHRAGSMRPQSSPPITEIAAAPESKFDGKWEGTFVGDSMCSDWNFPIEVTIEDGEFSTVVKQSDTSGSFHNKLEGSVSNDGRLSFWDSFEYILSVGTFRIYINPINISGQFTRNTFLAYPVITHTHYM